MTRPRGVIAYVMPEEVCGPFDRYALVIRGDEARMVHSEGVAYLVTADRPWCWTDYLPTEPAFTLTHLRLVALTAEQMDLADWVHEFSARHEDNFAQVYHWVNLNQSEVQS